MGQLTQAVSPRNTSKAPAFKTPSIKAPDSFDGTKAYKLRGYIQSCQLISLMTQQTSSLTGRRFCTQVLFSLVEMANGLNLTLQISPMKTLLISSIIGSYLKLICSLCLLPKKIPLFILDSNESTSLFITHYTKWVVDLPSFPSFEWDFFIIDSPKGEGLILGNDFLYHFSPIIDWKNGLITYYSSHKDSSSITSTINDFATAVKSVVLVGELKTTSLPPSVHIPSIIPSQSLLPSRDEVFKETKDVAISSLHLFQGDMDLPPLSFNASLKEQ
ncbi:hypothetical protein O181_016468 [Austropuccinia psidii MF-1]|uniref:Uncharacterized protein n=1 Tax=Austropuccinia psidii MF-1 TaxID=1389203 RepID=A0A9Q3GQW7_9BASI|nr:hypothetical protein [Austropuccinia psidii MF-1]